MRQRASRIDIGFFAMCFAALLSTSLVFAQEPSSSIYTPSDEDKFWFEASNMGDITALRQEAETNLAKGKYQQAAWQFEYLGDTARAEEAINQLKAVFKLPNPTEDRVGSGISRKVKLSFVDTNGNLVMSLFKPLAADIGCKTCVQNRAVAAYKINKALGFHSAPFIDYHTLTPQTRLGCAALGGLVKKFSRHCDSYEGTLVYWVGGDELKNFSDKSDEMRFFDAIIGNSDRHLGNTKIDEKGRQLFIDHNRTFWFTKDQYQSPGSYNTCWEEEIDLIKSQDSIASLITAYRNLTGSELRKLIGQDIPETDTQEFLNTQGKILHRLAHNAANSDKLPFEVCSEEKDYEATGNGTTSTTTRTN